MLYNASHKNTINDIRSHINDMSPVEFISDR